LTLRRLYSVGLCNPHSRAASSTLPFGEEANEGGILARLATV
jgi:hypothetical protein